MRNEFAMSLCCVTLCVHSNCNGNHDTGRRQTLFNNTTATTPPVSYHPAPQQPGTMATRSSPTPTPPPSSRTTTNPAKSVRFEHPQNHTTTSAPPRITTKDFRPSYQATCHSADSDNDDENNTDDKSSSTICTSASASSSEAQTAVDLQRAARLDLDGIRFAKHEKVEKARFIESPSSCSDDDEKSTTTLTTRNMRPFKHATPSRRLHAAP